MTAGKMPFTRCCSGQPLAIIKFKRVMQKNLILPWWIFHENFLKYKRTNVPNMRWRNFWKSLSHEKKQVRYPSILVQKHPNLNEDWRFINSTLLKLYVVEVNFQNIFRWILWKKIWDEINLWTGMVASMVVAMYPSKNVQ